MRRRGATLTPMPENAAAHIPRLNLAFCGGRGDAVVLLHGEDSSALQWRPVAVALARCTRVAVPSLLGWGASPAPLDARYTLDEHAAAVWALAEQVFGDRKVRFVGHGLGATIALACAWQRPEDVAEVIAFSPRTAPPRELLEQIRQSADDQLLRATAPDRLVLRALPAYRSVSALQPEEIKTKVAAITAPTLFVVPEQDTSTSRESIAALVAAMKSASVLSPQGGRLLPFEDPTETAKIIEPAKEDVLKAARREVPVEPRRFRRSTELVRGPAALLARRGLLAAVAALLLLADVGGERGVLQLLSLLYLLDGVHSTAGAFAMRGQGRPWTTWLLHGVASGAVGIWLTLAAAMPDAGWWPLGWVMRILVFSVAYFALGAVVSFVIVWRRHREARARLDLLLQEMSARR